MAIVPRDQRPAGGSILLLNGASSSGKTSLAKALQSLLPQQYLHVQLDTFRAMEPVEYFSREQAESGSLRQAALCRAMHSAVAEFAAHGQNVIFDHVLSDEAWHYLFEDFREQRLFLIGVHCSIGELVRRERARGDRVHGLAQSQVVRIHEGREYDFSVDTSQSSASASAITIGQWVLADPAPYAFAKMRARYAVV